MLLFSSISLLLFSSDVCLFNEDIPRNSGKYQTFFSLVICNIYKRPCSGFLAVSEPCLNTCLFKKNNKSIIPVRAFTKATV